MWVWDPPRNIYTKVRGGLIHTCRDLPLIPRLRADIRDSSQLNIFNRVRSSADNRGCLAASASWASVYFLWRLGSNELWSRFWRPNPRLHFQNSSMATQGLATSGHYCSRMWEVQLSHLLRCTEYVTLASSSVGSFHRGGVIEEITQDILGLTDTYGLILGDILCAVCN